MTKKEAAIVSVHTGMIIGSLGNFVDYASELMGRRLELQEIYELREELTIRSRRDFNNIQIT